MNEVYVSGTMDIPSQHIYDMPFQPVRIKDDSIYIIVDMRGSLQLDRILNRK
ncbi:MAG: hypothetical protein ABIY51_02725 [Ferruginibacter sp.]